MAVGNCGGTAGGSAPYSRMGFWKRRPFEGANLFGTIFDANRCPVGGAHARVQRPGGNGWAQDERVQGENTIIYNLSTVYHFLLDFYYYLWLILKKKKNLFYF